MNSYRGFWLCYCCNPRDQLELAWVWQLSAEQEAEYALLEKVPNCLATIPDCLLSPDSSQQIEKQDDDQDKSNDA